jgi:quercetin dioxygenase-like cupin family protein
LDDLDNLKVKRGRRVLAAKQAPAGPAPPRRSVCAPGTMSLHPYADRRREAMFMSKPTGPVAKSAGRTLPWKLMVAGAIVACAVGSFAIKTVQATPPTGFTATNLVGPVTVDGFDSYAEVDDWKVRIKAKGLSDVYVTHLKIVPGGDGGWHSHPGPSIITVKSGTATFYDECDDFTRHSYPAGAGFVEDAGCVHLLANEGDVDLEVVVVQIVPFGAPRRIDEPAPY